MAPVNRPLDQAPADWLRPSSWVIAFGVGLGAALSALLEPAREGQAWAMLGYAVVQGGAWFGYSLAGIFAVPAILWVLHRVVDFSDRLREFRGEAGADEPPETPLRSPLVDGGLNTMTDNELYIHEGLLLTLEHGYRAGGLTFSKIGHAWAGNTAHWGQWTNWLAAAGLAVKQNGVDTVLPPGKTFHWAISRVRQANYEMPEWGNVSTLPPLPAPLPPRDGV